MSKTIIVGLDGSQLAERALPYAEAFARALDAEVVLVRAIPPEGVSEPLPTENPHLLPYMVVMPTARTETVTEEERSQRHGTERYLDNLVEQLGARGIRASAVEVAGQAAKVLVEEAEAQGASLILLTTHGRSGLGRWIYGSVAEEVVAHSPVPVLLTRAWSSEHGLIPATGRPKILVPLDGDQPAEAALPVATSVARALQADVHLVEIVPALGEWALGDEAWLHDSPKDIEAEEEKEAAEYIATIRDRLRAEGLTVTSTVRVDGIGAGIAASAAANGATLVAMATHMPSGVERAVVGSTAVEVLHRANLPLLLVGPAASSV